MKLSIIIPAYNEEKRIIPQINSYYKFFNKKLKNNFEIIVVPNNCKDKTQEVVKKFANKKKNIIVFNIPHYSGKGGAVIQGFKLAKGDLVGFVDADESIIPIEFNKLLENINGYEGIIASRQIKGAIISPKRAFRKELGSFLFNRFTNLLFNLGFKDTQCGAKLFKKNVSNMIIKELTQKDWMFDVDLLYLCKKHRFKIKEYPIFWKDSEGSKLNFKSEIKSIINLLKYRFKIF